MNEQSKPIALLYLDQCVLSEIAKGKFPRLFDLIRSGTMRLIYSHVHISETARCRNQEFQSKVAQVLADMNGAYLSDSQLHFDKSPKQRLDECRSNPEVYDRVASSAEQLAHKFFGGQQGKDFQSIVDGQREAFADLMQYMVKNIKVLSDSEEPEIQQILAMLEKLPDLLIQQLEESSSQLVETFSASMPSQENFNATKEFRAAVEIDTSPLSSIRPPHVMQKIWEMVSASEIIPAQFNSANDFLAKGVWAHLNDGEPTWESKIRSFYTLLNLIGFCADEKLQKDGRFRSAMGDQMHAGLAAFAQVFITSDVRMAKKVFAIYEYLGISTLVCWCKDAGDGSHVLLVGEEMFSA